MMQQLRVTKSLKNVLDTSSGLPKVVCFGKLRDILGTGGNTVRSRIIIPLKFLLLDPIVNNSCNIKRCGNKLHQIDGIMMLSEYFQLN